MLAEISHDELSAALDETAGRLLAQAGVTEPPVDALAVARSLGMMLAWDERQPGRARIVRLRAEGGTATAILLRPDPRRERRHWAVAHEIGEAHAWRVFARLGIDPREAPADAREQVANRLAARLLLPGEWFARDAAGCGWDLTALKQRYATASHELVARRMLDLDVPVVITIFDQHAVTFRRANCGGAAPPLTAVEQRVRRAAARRGVPHAAQAACGAVQAWPIHEPGWSREIVRMELAGWE